MAHLITDKNEIDAIISEKIKGKRVVFTRYCDMSLAEKGLTRERVLEVFPQFDKVHEIEEETLKYGDKGYELFYNLSSNLYFSIATCPKEKDILIIHAVEYKRRLEKRFKRR
jgi:hypothetical protein